MDTPTKSLLGRVVGALMFTVLALAFLVTPLGFSLPLSGVGANIYAQLVKYKEVIISIGLILAVLDFVFHQGLHHHYSNVVPSVDAHLYKWYIFESCLKLKLSCPDSLSV